MNHPLFFLLHAMHRNWIRKRLADQRNDDINAAPHLPHSRYQKVFYRGLSDLDRRRRQRRIPREALLSVQRSPWRRILRSKNDQALITCTGFDLASLTELFAIIQPLYDHNSPFLDEIIVPIDSTKGRPRNFTHKDCVGLVLMWTRTRGPTFILQSTFGLTMTNMGVYLRFGRRLIVEAFRHHPLAKISIPSRSKIAEYQAVIGGRHESLQDVWATMDGLKLTIQQPSTDAVQSRYYNGWTHGHYVSSVFCFAPDGTIPIAFFNVPGSVHDSQIADWGNVYTKLERVYVETGGKCTVDSAFGCKDREYLIQSSQDDMVSNEATEEERHADIRMKMDATSMRQSAEWGMHMLQSAFPRLKDTFLYEEGGERRIYLKSIVLLNNLRARMVGINQIKNVYMPQLELGADDVIRNYN